MTLHHYRIEALRPSVMGNGNKPPSEAYANAGLDIVTRPYFTWSSLDVKFAGQVSPVSGRSLADIARTGGERLVSPCGNCGATLARCRCDFRGPNE